MANNRLLKFIDTLQRFNKKVEELRRESRFVKWLLKNILETKIIFAKPVQIKFKLPNKDIIKAFILTYRYFIQDRDGISTRKIKEIYDNLPINHGLKDRFYKQRDYLNNFLDSKPSFRIVGFGMTKNREILDTVIYGHLAHEGKAKRKRYGRWTEDPFNEKKILIYFCSILWIHFDYLLSIYEINKDTIKKLREIVNS